MDNLTQEFAQAKAHFRQQAAHCPRCHSHQTKQINIPAMGESLFECSHCGLVWRLIGEIRPKDNLRWQHLVRGQQLVNQWVLR